MNIARSRLIVALDVPGREEALALVNSLSGHAGLFKVGLELYVSEGPHFVSELVDSGAGVFLDLKLHDIPNTVAGAVRSAARLGVRMLTVHASGGIAMLEAAHAAAEASARPPLLLAVTVLTSISPQEAQRIGFVLPLDQWAERLGQTAREAGLRGLVSSPLELSHLRTALGADMQLVAPGIRPAGAQLQDQARASTPRAAILAGADFLVVGRPILQAPDPPAVADQIVAEIAAALHDAGRARIR
jgi:orotidine-5'-phosphate decarboxylase